MPRGHKISSIGGAVLAVCFFLPWAAVSCGGSQIAHVSGLDLAVGQVTVNTGYGSMKDRGAGGSNPELFLLPLAGLGAIALALRAMGQPRLTLLDRLGPIILGGLSLLLLLLQLGQSRSGAAGMGFEIGYRAGLWGVVLGSLAMIGGGLLNTPAPLASEPARPFRPATGPPRPVREPGPPAPNPGPPPPIPKGSSLPSAPSGSSTPAVDEPWEREAGELQPAAGFESCPACQRQVKAGSRFCMHCGQRM